MKIEIVVTTSWCHPEFGGTITEQKRFAIGDGLKAEKYYTRKSEESDKMRGFGHTSIYISHVL